MLRAERILTLIELLQAREEVTANELALLLGTSVRNVRRDLVSLRARGMAVEGSPGRGGGVRLVRHDPVPGVQLTVEEVAALWLTAHLSRVAAGLPWSRASRSGLDKLFASVSRERARELRAFCRRIVVGDSANEVVRASYNAPSPELIALFEQAFTKRVGLGFSYRDRHGVGTQRHVEPHGLLVKPPVWYVLSRDCDKGEPRSFRMDRIAAPKLLHEIRFRPDLQVIRTLEANHKRYR